MTLERDGVARHGGYSIWKLNRPYEEEKLSPDGLSIIMPTFNKKESLKRALASICNQRPCGMPVEIIVINDGSTDGTEELFTEKIESPDWIDVRYFETGVTEWTSPALTYNFGFKQAKYNYLVHSGADIIWAKPTMLSAIHRACDVDKYLIFSYYETRERHSDRDTFDLLGVSERGRTTLYPWCIVTSKEALRRVGFYEGDYKPGAGEDDAMILKLATIGIKFCRVEGHAIVNQEHKKEYIRDAQWQANTQFNVRLGYQAAAELKRKIARGELERF
jgi:glycosyltransferase involved in cell wall biosynthesis